jgi:hypothetical protein
VTKAQALAQRSASATFCSLIIWDAAPTVAPNGAHMGPRDFILNPNRCKEFELFFSKSNFGLCLTHIGMVEKPVQIKRQSIWRLTPGKRKPTHAEDLN